MKQQNTLLTIGLILAIVVTTFAPATFAVNHSKSPANQRRLNPTISERAGKPQRKKIDLIEYPNPEFFGPYRRLENLRIQRERTEWRNLGGCFPEYINADHMYLLSKHERQRYLERIKGIQEKNLKETERHIAEHRIISSLSKEDRKFLYELINESGNRIFKFFDDSQIPSGDVKKFELCIRYLKDHLMITITSFPEHLWYESLKPYFDNVFKEKSELALSKLFSHLTSQLGAPVEKGDHFNANYSDILGELKRGRLFASHF